MPEAKGEQDKNTPVPNAPILSNTFAVPGASVISLACCDIQLYPGMNIPPIVTQIMNHGSGRMPAEIIVFIVVVSIFAIPLSPTESPVIVTSLCRTAATTSVNVLAV